MIENGPKNTKVSSITTNDAGEEKTAAEVAAVPSFHGRHGSDGHEW